jgi:hypothetical protein
VATTVNDSQMEPRLALATVVFALLAAQFVYLVDDFKKEREKIKVN